jgi:hypothetical protein
LHRCISGARCISYDDLENKPPTITATQIDDNLTSNSVTNALSANQGRIIKDLIDAKVATQIDDLGCLLYI